MHFVGIDLAWGERNPTGLAVLDAEGRLVHVSTVVTDDEVVAALAPFTEGPCLVAVDAPLIVTNPTGNRAAEAALNKDFAPFDAGAHPTNTGRAEFAGRPRAARIASRLGLDMNPRSGRARRAIEVYPHPATVALFRLGRTLKYKSKSGRSLEQLRAELLVLMGLMESLSGADPRLVLDGEAGGEAWRGLRTTVERAQRKSELRVAEDQVDAVLCAYVALFATTHPERTTTYGTFEQGYVVTPTLTRPTWCPRGAGRPPTPRRARSPTATQMPMQRTPALPYAATPSSCPRCGARPRTSCRSCGRCSTTPASTT
ncbi:DUF429 domain-containing protein [Nocardioides daphniae]|uniref:DUF429 domain-containing protein n=1 Tax=Nocardioides daphniae TaxID=402297 RepID=A0A4P7U7X0_9ACTN|nr:DUF429 domain-containing protein [Nocardioides daphniae]QCC76180.1 DUF429 domain-containing protein [Nocardioides daphniae]